MKYKNVLFPSDVTGTGVWRLLWPMHEVSNDPEIETTVMRHDVMDPNYFKGMNMIMLQRPIADFQMQYIKNILIPASKTFGIWLTANLDDCLHPDEIPEYNMGRPAYLTSGAVNNIKFMLDNLNMLIVSTDELSTYYQQKYNVDPRKILKVLNYLPDWEFGHKYNERDTMDLVQANIKRPRIGIISSTSHYNQDPNSKVKDDLDLIYDLIINTIDKYRWVFLGSLPHKITPYVKAGKIEYHQGVHIYNYPNAIKSLNVNCIVAPLIDNTFNRCKSNIKILEASALGIPFFVQNLPNYSRYTEHTFSDQLDLEKKLKHFFNLSKYNVRDIIRSNYEWLKKPHPEGNGWWMSGNRETYKLIFKIKHYSSTLNLADYAKYYMANLKNAEVK